jgi:hypothetical protein
MKELPPGNLLSDDKDKDEADVCGTPVVLIEGAEGANEIDPVGCSVGAGVSVRSVGGAVDSNEEAPVAVDVDSTVEAAVETSVASEVDSTVDSTVEDSVGNGVGTMGRHIIRKQTGELKK